MYQAELVSNNALNALLRKKIRINHDIMLIKTHNNIQDQYVKYIENKNAHVKFVQCLYQILINYKTGKTYVYIYVTLSGNSLC